MRSMKGRMTGLEPANDGATTHCLKPLGHTRHITYTTIACFLIYRLVFELYIYLKQYLL